MVRFAITLNVRPAALVSLAVVSYSLWVAFKPWLLK
jgi:hypothetical protein